MFLLLPNGPSTAWFLNSNERRLAVGRLQTSASKQVRVLKKSQIIECFMDPQVWLLFCYTFCINIGNGGLSSFGSLIVSGFGYSTTRTYVMQIPVACSQIFWILLGAIMTNYIKNSRIFIMFFFVVMSLIGAAMMFGISHSEPGKRLAGFCLTVAYVANLPLSFSLITSNVAGFTKKSTALALIFVAYCVGNIAGPQFFKSSESPNYPVRFPSATSYIYWLLLDWTQSRCSQLRCCSFHPSCLEILPWVGESQTCKGRGWSRCSYGCSWREGHSGGGYGWGYYWSWE